MKKKQTIIMGAAVILAIFVVVIIMVRSHADSQGEKETNANVLKTTESMVSLQSSYEEAFTTSGYSIDDPHVILDPYQCSPLTALILFETEDAVSPKVTVKGKDELTTFTYTFASTKKHYLPIYGLYPDSENEITITYHANNKPVQKQVSIKTAKLPDDFILPTQVDADKSRLTNDLYFFTPSAKGYTCAYDVNGDVRWYLTNYALWDNTRLANGHMLISTERLINTPYYMSGLYEIDLLGKIYCEYSLPGGYHHDYFELPNGNLLVASNDFNNKAGTVEDYIVELNRTTGKIVKTFDLKDILNRTDGKSENWSDYDWFHNNSVWYDEKSNAILLSGRHQDAVISIDYDSGALNWILGDPTNWSKEYQKYFFTPVGDQAFEWQWSQHAAMMTPEGYVFVLDNGNNKSKIKANYVDAAHSYTRGVMYQINTDQMTIKQIWEYGKARGSQFYSPYISDVDYLGKNHYIVHSGGIVYVDGKNSNQPAGFSTNADLVSDTVELIDDEVVFEIKLPTNNYRVEKLPLYDDSVNHYQTGIAKRLGTLGETAVSETRKAVNDAVSPDEEYNAHHISFTKEEDRLIFSGQFKRGKTVNILLKKGNKVNVYNVRISKHPYTALCVDIFTEEENENGIVISSYINAEGLSGTYSLYLEIDGKLYDVKQSVAF